MPTPLINNALYKNLIITSQQVDPRSTSFLPPQQKLCHRQRLTQKLVQFLAHSVPQQLPSSLKIYQSPPLKIRRTLNPLITVEDADPHPRFHLSNELRRLSTVVTLIPPNKERSKDKKLELKLVPTLLSLLCHLPS